MLLVLLAGAALWMHVPPSRAPSPPPAPTRRAPVATVEREWTPPQETGEALFERMAREDRAEERYLSECAQRGGRRCCGQGGCCGLEDVPLTDLVSADMPWVDGELPTRTVEALIHRQAEAIETCYAREQLEQDWLDLVFVNLDIAKDGRVARSDGSGFDDAVARCAASVLQQIRFPRPASGTVEVRISFRFRERQRE